MLLSAVYRILCVTCLLYANFQLCCATDEVVDEKTARIICMGNCSHLTKDVYTTQRSSEIWNHQSCFKQCLRNFGKDNFVRKHQEKDGSRRSKRETSVVQTNSTDLWRHEQEWRCTNDCEEDGDGNYLAIDKKCIDVFFYEENGSIYANVSWSCPHALELANLTSYKLIYYWDHNPLDYPPTHCCREIEKTDTSTQMNISLHGLKEQKNIFFKVVPLPRMHIDKSPDYSYWKVDLSNGLTDIRPTDKPSETCEVKPSLCQEDEKRRVNAIPAKNITITFHKLRDTGRFYANISWIPPPAGPANFTGYRLIYIMGRYWDYCCRDVNKTTTSAIVDRFTKGLKGNEIFRVKVLTLPLTRGTPADLKRKRVQLTSTANPETTSPSQTSEGKEVVVTSKTPETINQSSSSSSTSHVSRESISASLSKGNKASREKILIITAPSIFVLLVVTVSVYWYFRYLSTQRQPAPEEYEQDVDYDAFIIYSSADEKWVNKILCPILEEKHGLRCCVHHRDFVVGKPFRENMADSVYKSRKIIAVVSRNFFKSKYCSQEMDMALGRSLDRGDDSVIVIKYDGVDTRKLPKALRQRSYIDYPKLVEKEMWERRLVDCLKHVPGKKTSPVSFV